MVLEKYKGGELLKETNTKNDVIDSQNNNIIQGYYIERDYGNEDFEECVKNLISAKLLN